MARLELHENLLCMPELQSQTCKSMQADTVRELTSKSEFLELFMKSPYAISMSFL